MADLAPIAGKLKPLIRLLSSNQDGEVLAAAHALNRLLKINGSDIHAIADSVGQANSKLTEAEMRKLYDAGFEAGVRAVENKQHGDEDFRDTEGKPTPERMVRYCQRRVDRLREREREFIDSVAARAVYGEPSVKQLKWLTSIYLRLGGGRP